MPTPLPTQNKAVKILLVEDNPNDVFLIQEALNRCKHRVYLGIAYDGEEALSYLRHEGVYASTPNPDLILMDLNLPRISGWEVLEAVKGDFRIRRIPVVLVSTAWSEWNNRRAHEMNAEGYLVKPLDMAQFPMLIHTIEKLFAS
jgi:CheY-like chemotaxis protein